MEIRSVTVFVEGTHPLQTDGIHAAGALATQVRQALETSGWKVQTTRLALQPFSRAVDLPYAVDHARAVESAATEAGLNYVSLGPITSADAAEWLEVIPEVLGATSSTFMSAEIAADYVIHLARLRQLARCIQKISTISPDGFANLKFAALANVKPWSPFFPAAYHGGGQTVVAIATESADLAVETINSASDVQQARTDLIRAIETSAHKIETTARSLVEKSGSRFEGIDFSFAPYPSEARSIGKALEQLGLGGVGQSGTLMVSAWLTGILQEAQFTRTGFCGLMLPVLEDTTLAMRAAEGRLGITELLAFSAVCGTGLDTIPLAGDVSREILAAILGDVAALAIRLGKQLTARLMPLPGKQAGDLVKFDFEYFAVSRVMDAANAVMGNKLGGDAMLRIPALYVD